MSTPEEQAALQGWKPESEWTGPKEAWKSAQQFLDDGEHIVSRVRGKLEKQLEESQKQFEERLARIEKTSRAALEAQKAQADKQRDELLAQLNAQKKAAIEDNDLAKLEDVREKIADVKASVPEPDQEGLKAAKEFKAKHEFWQGKDWTLQNFADGAAGRLQGRGLSPTEFFAELDRQIRDAFPEKFGKPKRGGLEADSPASGGSDEKTYADLPKEAKSACDDFVKRGLFKSKQAYVNEYFGVEA